VNFQFDLARLLLDLNNWQEAMPLAQRVVAFRRQTVGEDHYFTLDARYTSGRAYEQKGDMEAAANTYAAVYPHFAKYFVLDTARDVSKSMAVFFVRQQRYSDARGVFEGFRNWFEANPPQNSADFESFITASAAVGGWPAAAEVCRTNFDRFSDLLWLWLNKAWIFRYVGDESRYRQVVARVLALAPNVASTNDQHVPVEIAGLGPFPFSPEQIKQLKGRVESLEVVLPSRATNVQAWGYRAIGQLQLRLGQLQESLAALEKADLKQAAPEPYNLFIKAICLHRLGRAGEARAAFDQAETMMKPLLTESPNPTEPFLPAWQIYQQLFMHREARAELVRIHPKP
jgi:tetratricopeptide (TPR) repeat protein